MSGTDQIINLAVARGGKSMLDWMNKLAKGDKGELPTLGNAGILFRNDDNLTKLVALNEFTGDHMIMRAPPPFEDDADSLPGPYPRQWGPEDVSLILGYMQRRWCHRFNKQTVEDAMLASAALNHFHPVADWLHGLKWDGKERIDTWLYHAFGCKKDAYHEAVGSKFLIAAVRRIFHPGCKFDSMPVLEGFQNIGKSRTCKALFGEELFSDALPHDLGSRDAALGLMGKWGIELGELDSLIRTEVETVKAFLSRSTDRYRPPYGKHYVERPRHGVLIGTTNQNDYLRDTTGNRRFWPIRCEKAEHAWVAEVREQLWAEAVQREAEGETIWLEEGDVSRAAIVHQSERLVQDVWANRVRDWVSSNGRQEVQTHSILVYALNLETAQQTRGNEMRVTNVLRADGWMPHVYRPSAGAKPTRAWFAPGAILPNTGGKTVPLLQTEVLLQPHFGGVFE